MIIPSAGTHHASDYRPHGAAYDRAYRGTNDSADDTADTGTRRRQACPVSPIPTPR